jgi:hypothetical protein
VLVGGLVAVLLGVPAARGSTGKELSIPRGFAYAAQVRIAVTYDASFDQSTSREQVCTDPASGEQTTTYLAGSESREARITVVYAPITIPVTTLSRLGSAASALTITRTGGVSGQGAITGASDVYRFSGQGLEYPSCTAFPWSCAGSFATATGYQPGLELRTGADGYDPIALTVKLEGATTATPADCAGGDQEIDVTSTLDQAMAAAQSPWGMAELDRGLTRDFDELANRRSVTIVSSPPGQCSYASACEGAVSTQARVVITRLALERTTRGYRG